MAAFGESTYHHGTIRSRQPTRRGQISSELQPLREKQEHQVQKPGDLVEFPQFVALLFLLSAE
jgi:hypothetical protein